MKAKAIIRTIRAPGRDAPPVTIWPLGDVHIGAAACDEKAFTRDVKRIADDPHALWIGMGDYADLIRRNDPRFETGELADWITVSDLRDIAGAQRDRFLELTRPIWGQCLALVSGNHEGSILRHCERDIFGDIVTAIQPSAFAPGDPLGIDYEGYIRLRFVRAAAISGTSLPFVALDIYAHHGHGGGKLMGAKALNLGREAGWHDVDVILMGHTHTPLAFPAWRRWIDRRGNIRTRRITAVVTGTYSIDPAYARRKGYGPGGYAVPRVVVAPWGTGGLDDAEAVRVLV